MREFVVEQYLGAACSDVAAGRADAARRAAEQLTSEGTPDAVRAVGARAVLAIERIAEAVSDSGVGHRSPGDAGRTLAVACEDEREC